MHNRSSSLFRQAIDEMEGYAPGEWPALDSGVLKLNSNENPYPPSPNVLSALREIDGELLRRYPNPRGQTFCEVAGEIFGVPADWVMVGNGSDDLLTLLVRACAEPGRRQLAYPTPTYVLYRTLAAMQPATTQEIAYQQKDESWLLPIEELVAARAAVTLIATPNSPTGHLVSLLELRELAQKVSGVLVIDEAYVDFVGAGADKVSLDLVREFDNVIVLRTLSKGYGLAGLRLGFAFAQPTLLKGLLKVKDSYNVDAIALKLGKAALRDQAYKNRCTQKVITARNQLSKHLQALSFKVWPSQTNFLLVQPPANTAKKICSELKEKRIMIRYFSQPGLDDKLRITVGRVEQNERLVGAIASMLE